VWVSLATGTIHYFFGNCVVSSQRFWRKFSRDFSRSYLMILVQVLVIRSCCFFFNCEQVLQWFWSKFFGVSEQVFQWFQMLFGDFSEQVLHRFWQFLSKLFSNFRASFRASSLVFIMVWSKFSELVVQQWWYSAVVIVTTCKNSEVQVTCSSNVATVCAFIDKNGTGVVRILWAHFFTVLTD